MEKYTVTITDLVCCDNRIEEVDPWEVDLEGILKEWFSDEPEEEEPYISKYINKIVTWARSGKHAHNVQGVFEAESYLRINLEMEEVKPQGLR